MVRVLSLTICILTALHGAVSVSALAADKVQNQIATDDANLAVVLTRDDKIKHVKHLDGISEVPLAAKRIVALHNSFSESLIALGMAPAGAVERPQGAPVQLKAAMTETISVGDQSNPDYEKILILQPDLILSVGDVHSQNIDLLKAIAPVVSLREPEEDWRPWLIGLGDVLERQSQAEKLIDDYNQRVEKLRLTLLVEHKDETVLLMRVRQKDIRIYGTERRSGPVLYRDLQLTPHRLVPVGKNYEAISNELIGQMDADRIFLMVEDAERLGNIEKTALWQGLPAVKAGRVYKVNIEPWNQSSGPISASVIVDDVARAFGLTE
ncbi:ABC transporter substrate-binding protein [Paenochrobactrum sp. BZR 588]|uniref:ABC transporter substrate-binding protein n=1 Tax=Paenochrobactrum TaxID=999488 RepID=UPI0035BBD37C